MAGRYATVFKGRGMDFDRVREYVPGDDVRTIDWNVTARTGDPLHQGLHRGTGTHDHADDRHQWLVRFGSVEQTKRELSAEAAGVLAASAIRNQRQGRPRSFH